MRQAQQAAKHLRFCRAPGTECGFCAEGHRPPSTGNLGHRLPSTGNKTPTMPLRAAELDADADFDGLIACEWAAFEEPFQGILRIICPIVGTGPAARADSLKESTQRQLAWYKSDPAAHWQKAVDDDGRIVGGALWKVFGGNPFAKSSGRPAPTWQPEGPQRDFAGAVLERLDVSRKEKARRAQVCM